MPTSSSAWSGLRRTSQDIKTAAIDRNDLLQRMQNAENYEDVKRLEREVAAAMVLFDRSRKESGVRQPIGRQRSPAIPPTLPPILRRCDDRNRERQRGHGGNRNAF